MDPSTDISGTRDGRRRTAVMADVAKLAGVSHQTVSRVINDSAHVRPETRRRRPSSRTPASSRSSRARPD